MKYIPLKEHDIQIMMKFLNISSFEELFSDIPSQVLLKNPLDIPKFNDRELYENIKETLSKNILIKPNNMYIGGGVWPIYIPPVVKAIISRTEFLTAYTPYQAEVSQGIMQALFEYQSLIAEILDMDVVNSSMYDWSSAVGEALLMAGRITKKNVVLIPKEMPFYRKEVIKTYLWGAGLKYLEYPHNDEGDIDTRFLKTLKNSDNFAGLYLEYPNGLGYIYSNIKEVENFIHNEGGILIFGVDPITLPILKPPRYYNADIVVGEGQPLGTPSFFGGPLLGIFAVRKDMKLIREMPGRIIGLTKSIDGEGAFAMILQTREQHIRRERATSNICTNEALTALTSAVYLSALGADGLINLSKKLLEKAHILFSLLSELGFKGVYDLPFFREFSVKPDIPYNTKKLITLLLKKKILFGGLYTSYHTISINEYHSKNDFQYLIENIRGVSK